MNSKVIKIDCPSFSQNLNSALISGQKQLSDRKPLTIEKKSIFPQAPRKMIWKKNNGQLVAQWISTN